MSDLRAIRDRWAATLPLGEESELAVGDQLAREVARADAWRRANGIAPLADEDHPELEFHRRARALGLCG